MNIEKLIEIACEIVGCSVDEFHNSSKRNSAATARKFVSYYLYDNGYRNEKIAEAIGYSKNIVSYNHQRFKTMKNNPDIQYMYSIFMDEVGKMKQ